ncbi:MAG: arsenical-resistance protein [Arthrobacter sp.]|nr:arsenical-resistance protein [Arthrobacter sp.]
MEEVHDTHYAHRLTFIDIGGNTSYIDFHQSITEQRRRPVSTRTETPPTRGDEAVVGKLSTLDRFLPVWIIAAMALGLLLGNLVPGLNTALEAVKVGEVSLPIAVGLLVMMYPVLAKVRYDQTRRVIGDRKLMISSLVINWLLAPAFMFVLAWLFLADLPEYRTGLIIVGLARCIAMVMIWNDLACGDRESAAVLVAINSVFQVVAFGALGWFYLQLLPSWLGLPTTSADFSFWAITLSVLIFLGIPLLAGFLTRTLGEKAKGRDWYEGTFLPRLGPWALYGLLFTITLLFALQGETIAARPLDVARIALPLLVYFVVVFGAGMVIGKWLDLGYAKTTTLAFTAAGNNFELAIAVAIGTFGVTSGQALAGVVGPLIEVPTLVALVYAALWARKRFFTPATASF